MMPVIPQKLWLYAVTIMPTDALWKITIYNFYRGVSRHKKPQNQAAWHSAHVKSFKKSSHAECLSLWCAKGHYVLFALMCTVQKWIGAKQTIDISSYYNELML